MAAAANYARANRQLLTEATRRVFEDEVGVTLELVHDLSHDLAKLKVHDVNGRPRTLCVHRKGATRSLPPGHRDLPHDLAPVGQPVLVPGTMGTASYFLAGVPDNPAFCSTAHGAGRVQSRHQAARGVSGKALRDSLQARGILVRGASWRGLAEERPEAYKDVDAVVEVSHQPGSAARSPGSAQSESSKDDSPRTSDVERHRARPPVGSLGQPQLVQGDGLRQGTDLRDCRRVNHREPHVNAFLDGLQLGIDGHIARRVHEVDQLVEHSGMSRNDNSADHRLGDATLSSRRPRLDAQVRRVRPATMPGACRRHNHLVHARLVSTACG